jgi:hypothetical protein
MDQTWEGNGVEYTIQQQRSVFRHFYQCEKISVTKHLARKRIRRKIKNKAKNKKKKETN